MDLFSASFPKIFPLISLSCFHSRPTVEFTLGIHPLLCSVTIDVRLGDRKKRLSLLE